MQLDQDEEKSKLLAQLLPSDVPSAPEELPSPELPSSASIPPSPSLPKEGPSIYEQFLKNALIKAAKPEDLMRDYNTKFAASNEDYNKALSDAKNSNATNTLVRALAPMADRQSAISMFYKLKPESSGLSEMAKASEDQNKEDVDRKAALLKNYRDLIEKQRADQMDYTQKLLGTGAHLAGIEEQGKLRQQMASQNRDIKAEQQLERAESEMRKNLETMRGNSAAQQAALDTYSANKALSLVKGKDPNSLTMQDLRMLNSEMAKIGQGGVPTEHGVQELMPNNLKSKLAELENFLNSEPTQAQMGDYVKHNMKYLEEMKDVAEDRLRDYRTNIAKGYKTRVKPEAYQMALADYGLNTPSHSMMANQAQNPAPENVAPKPDQAAAKSPAIPLGTKRLDKEGKMRVRTKFGWELAP